MQHTPHVYMTGIACVIVYAGSLLQQNFTERGDAPRIPPLLRSLPPQHPQSLALLPKRQQDRRCTQCYFWICTYIFTHTHTHYIHNSQLCIYIKVYIHVVHDVC